MIHRFIELFGERLPDIPVLATDNSPLQTHSIWAIGNTAVPRRLNETAVSVLTLTGQLADPEREPSTGDTVVYCYYTTSTVFVATIVLALWDDSAPVTVLYSDSAGLARSLQPTWKPDGSKILFRAKGSGSVCNLIKHMNPDGSSPTTLYTGGGEVENPEYNSDGTRIAWREANTIKVANADGSSPSTIFTPGGITVVGAPYWHPSANTILFRHDGGTFTSNEEWKTMTDTGGSVTTWLTISRASGYGPGDGDPAGFMYTWLANGTQFVTTQRVVADPDPDSRLGLVDTSGMTFVSPAQYGASNAGSQDTRPAAITGRSEGVERLYWMSEPSGLEVVSVLPDGSDFRVDWDGAGLTAGGSIFHGFRGDTQNV